MDHAPITILYHTLLLQISRQRWWRPLRYNAPACIYTSAATTAANVASVCVSRTQRSPFPLLLLSLPLPLVDDCCLLLAPPLLLLSALPLQLSLPFANDFAAANALSASAGTTATVSLAGAATTNIFAADVSGLPLLPPPFPLSLPPLLPLFLLLCRNPSR